MIGLGVLCASLVFFVLKMTTPSFVTINTSFFQKTIQLQLKSKEKLHPIRGVASADIVTPDFNPAKSPRRTIGSVHITNKCIVPTALGYITWFLSQRIKIRCYKIDRADGSYKQYQSGADLIHVDFLC